MKQLLLPSVTLSLLALAACGESKPIEVTSTAPDPQAAEVAKRGPVELPPMMTGEVTFRCKDQSLPVVSFFQGDKQVLVKADKAGSPTKLVADKAGDPYKAEGYELTGDKTAITLTQPGKPSQACKA